MVPVCWSIQMQLHDRTISYLHLPELQHRHLTKSILIDFLNYSHVGQVSGRVSDVCPASVDLGGSHLSTRR